MTHEEAAILRSRKDGLLFTSAGDKVMLLGSPCPFWDNGCTVYAQRPYNCRRFLCGREDGEPFDPQPIPAKVLKVKKLRQQYARNQAHHQTTWAKSHGWEDE